VVFAEQMRKYYIKSLRNHERTVVEIKSRRGDCKTIQRFLLYSQLCVGSNTWKTTFLLWLQEYVSRASEILKQCDVGHVSRERHTVFRFTRANESREPTSLEDDYRLL
jgi:hypothetical protein